MTQNESMKLEHAYVQVLTTSEYAEAHDWTSIQSHVWI